MSNEHYEFTLYVHKNNEIWVNNNDDMTWKKRVI